MALKGGNKYSVTYACRLVFQHQHKLKQVAEDYRDYNNDYSFKFSDLSITLAEPNQLKIKPDVNELKFGHFFTDHMLKIFYHKAGGWQKPEIIPFENISLHPAAKVLHYATQSFDGMKAYKGVDNKIRIFRPDMNMNRMNYSSISSGLPTFAAPELIKCIKKLISIDQEWVPQTEASSLYIRTVLIGIEDTLGVCASDSALLYTILCPVSSYHNQESASSVTLLANPNFTRAWPGGCGDRKISANYGPTMRMQKQAVSRGRQQVLWLFGEDHQITEVGAMNVFVFYVSEKGEKILATPPASDLILPGVVRKSIIQLTQEWNEYQVVERIITMSEIIEMQKENRLLEMFGCGTACIVSPISGIEYMDVEVKIPTMEQSKPIYKRILEQLCSIQYGHVAHSWAQIVDE